MTSVQLLLSDDANRRALASLIADRYDPIVETEFQEATLHIVDDASLPRYQDQLADYKDRKDPVFCPVILIRRERTSINIDLPDPDPDARPLLINEFVTAPVDQQILFQQVANLLARRQQTKELDEANERLEQFAQTLRHELRNPLNILDGYIGAARECDDDIALDRCRTATDRMKRLLDDTIMILNEGDIELDTTDVCLPVACEESWEIITEQQAKLDVTTTKEIVADQDRLAQLLGNLFRNAVEHGGSDLTVTVGSLDDGFYVEDDGPGIPQDRRETVFEEGFTTNNAGSGLGLAVVRRVVEAHQWEIQAIDGTDGGARFEIRTQVS